jgi:hypothetical protein
MGGDMVGVPDVASRLNLKRSRAYQLLRMLAFPPELQQAIVLLRLQERQLLPLIDAYHQEQVTLEQSSVVLRRLREIAAERALSSRQLADHETTRSVEAPRRSGIENTLKQAWCIGCTARCLIARCGVSYAPKQAATAHQVVRLTHRRAIMVYESHQLMR